MNTIVIMVNLQNTPFIPNCHNTIRAATLMVGYLSVKEIMLLVSFEKKSLLWKKKGSTTSQTSEATGYFSVSLNGYYHCVVSFLVAITVKYS